MMTFQRRASGPQSFASIVFWFLLIWGIGTVCIFAVLGLVSVFAAEPTPRPVQPLVILPPSGQPTYAHPSPSPSGPMTILPPASLPVYVHPSPSHYAPATVLVPGELPTFIWPGVE